MRDEILEFYKLWLEKGSWSFAEAIALYCGYDPDTDSYVYSDIKNHEGYEETLLDTKNIYNKGTRENGCRQSLNGNIILRHKKRIIGSGRNLLQGRDEEFSIKKKTVNLRSLINAHVKAKKINTLASDNGELFFEPSSICNWIYNQSDLEPLPEMLSTMKFNDEVKIASCREWLKSVVQNDPEKTSGKTKVSLQKHATIKYDVTKWYFDRSIWPEVTRGYPKWQKSGRPTVT